MPRPTKLNSLRIVSQILTTATTLLHNDSGKTFYLNSATEFAVTLPKPQIGAKFTFIVKAAPSGASYTVVNHSTDNLIHGNVVTSADGTAADTTAGTVTGAITFADGNAKVGDRVDIESDGTYWYATAYASAADGITFDVQSSKSPSVSPSASPSLSPSLSPSISPSVSPSS